MDRDLEQKDVPPTPLRVCALILNCGDVCLIRRTRPRGDQYSLPGGIVNGGEPVAGALARELREELGLAVLPRRPELRGVQEQCTTRPDGPVRSAGSTSSTCSTCPTTLAGPSPPPSWRPRTKPPSCGAGLAGAAGLHLCPAVGSAPGAVREAGAVVLPPMTNETYRWR